MACQYADITGLNKLLEGRWRIGGKERKQGKTEAPYADGNKIIFVINHSSVDWDLPLQDSECLTSWSHDVSNQGELPSVSTASRTDASPDRFIETTVSEPCLWICVGKKRYVGVKILCRKQHILMFRCQVAFVLYKCSFFLQSVSSDWRKRRLCNNNLLGQVTFMMTCNL